MAAVLRHLRTAHMTGQKRPDLAASLFTVRDTARRAAEAWRQFSDATLNCTAAVRDVEEAPGQPHDPPA